MTTAVKNKARRTARKSASSQNDKDNLKPFSVVSGPYLFWFTPSSEGFSVTCQNVPGVNAQGDTFEEALHDANICAAFVEECRRDIDRKEAVATRKRTGK